MPSSRRSGPIPPTRARSATPGCGAGRGIPNYFFEWFGWLAYPVIAIPFADPLSYLWGFLSLLAPVFMYWILVHVTGVPPLEEQMLKSRGERYSDYQARTSRSSRAAAIAARSPCAEGTRSMSLRRR